MNNQTTFGVKVFCNGNLAEIQDLPREATVITLKHKLMTLYNFKGCRIIYSGRLLQSDDELVSSIVEKNLNENVKPTFHVVLNNPTTMTDTPSSATTNQFKSKRPPPQYEEELSFGAAAAAASSNVVVPPTLPQQQQTPSINNIQQPEPQHQQQHQPQVPHNNIVQQVPNNMIFNNNMIPNNIIPQFIAPMQVVMINGLPYAMMQNPAAFQNPQPPQQVTNNNNNNNANTGFFRNNVVNNNDQANENQQPQPQQQQQQPELVDDEFGDADRPVSAFWLLLKLCFIVYILSQNASAFRVAMLYCTALLIFLVQTNWIPIDWMRRGPRLLQRPENERPPDNNNNNHNNNADDDGTTTTATTEGGDDQVGSGGVGRRESIGYFRTFQNLVWSFVASLIPEQT